MFFEHKTKLILRAVLLILIFKLDMVISCSGSNSDEANTKASYETTITDLDASIVTVTTTTISTNYSTGICKSHEEHCGYQPTSPPENHGKCCAGLTCDWKSGTLGGPGKCVKEFEYANWGFNKMITSEAGGAEGGNLSEYMERASNDESIVAFAMHPDQTMATFFTLIEGTASPKDESWPLYVRRSVNNRSWEVGSNVFLGEFEHANWGFNTTNSISDFGDIGGNLSTYTEEALRLSREFDPIVAFAIGPDQRRPWITKAEFFTFIEGTALPKDENWPIYVRRSVNNKSWKPGSTVLLGTFEHANWGFNKMTASEAFGEEGLDWTLSDYMEVASTDESIVAFAMHPDRTKATFYTFIEGTASPKDESWPLYVRRSVNDRSWKAGSTVFLGKFEHVHWGFNNMNTKEAGGAEGGNLTEYMERASNDESIVAFAMHPDQTMATFFTFIEGTASPKDESWPLYIRRSLNKYTPLYNKAFWKPGSTVLLGYFDHANWGFNNMNTSEAFGAEGGNLAEYMERASNDERIVAFAMNPDQTKATFFTFIEGTASPKDESWPLYVRRAVSKESWKAGSTVKLCSVFNCVLP